MFYYISGSWVFYSAHYFLFICCGGLSLLEKVIAIGPGFFYVNIHGFLKVNACNERCVAGKKGSLLWVSESFPGGEEHCFQGCEYSQWGLVRHPVFRFSESNPVVLCPVPQI